MFRPLFVILFLGLTLDVSAQSAARIAACGDRTDAECLMRLGEQSRGSRSVQAERLELIAELVASEYRLDWLRLALLQHDTPERRAMLPPETGCYAHPVDAFNRVPRGELVWARSGMLLLVDGDKLNLLVSREDSVERCELTTAVGTMFLDEPAIQSTSLGDEGMLLAVPTTYVQVGTGGQTTREITTVYWVGPERTSRVVEIPTLVRDEWTGGCETGVGRCETNERRLPLRLRDGSLVLTRARSRGDRRSLPPRRCMARMVEGANLGNDWGAPVCLLPGNYVLRAGALVRR